MPATAAERTAKRRANLRAQGLKQVTLWVPDPDAPGYREKIARDIAAINAADRRDPWMSEWLDQCLNDIEGWTA